MKRFLILAAVLLSTTCLLAETLTFRHVKIRRHRSAEKRVLVDKVGILTFDDASQKLTFVSDIGDKFDTQDKIEAPYDAVSKIVFEETTHMRGGGAAQVISGATVVGAIIGTKMAGQHVRDYWLYLEYKNGDHNDHVLLEIPRDSTDAVIGKATTLFGPKVTIALFPEIGQEVKTDTLADFKSKHTLKIDKTNRPSPEVKPDKATIFVVCPPLAARDSGKGNQFKLHANDHVVAINRAGTYSFAYLDPGKYHLVSQSENANGFEMNLEAGRTYYFLQNTFQGTLRWRTSLSRNSPELVMYLADGTYFSDWERK